MELGSERGQRPPGPKRPPRAVPLSSCLRGLSPHKPSGSSVQGRSVPSVSLRATCTSCSHLSPLAPALAPLHRLSVLGAGDRGARSSLAPPGSPRTLSPEGPTFLLDPLPLPCLSWITEDLSEPAQPRPKPSLATTLPTPVSTRGVMRGSLRASWAPGRSWDFVLSEVGPMGSFEHGET